MNVQEAIRKANYDDVWKILKEDYYSDITEPSRVANTCKKYKGLVKDLLSRRRLDKKSKTILYVMKYPTVDDENNVDIALYYGDEPSDEKIYSMSFVEWNEVLSCHVLNYSIEQYGLAFCVANILYEISFYGFDEAETISVKEELNDRVREIDEYSAEGRLDEICTPMEDLEELLGIELPEHTEEEKALIEKAAKRCQEIKNKFDTEMANQYKSLVEKR